LLKSSSFIRRLRSFGVVERDPLLTVTQLVAPFINADQRMAQVTAKSEFGFPVTAISSEDRRAGASIGRCNDPNTFRREKRCRGVRTAE
jgi:hypothetical protein